MLSGDGRFVASSSGASNLVADDTNGRSDIFVHDRMTGETTRVSVAADGAQGDANSIGTAAISADGRFVAFVSDATNFVPHAGSIRQAYVKDRLTGAIELVSVDRAGKPAVGFVAAAPAISGDSRFVAFASNASNLVKKDTNGTTDVFVHDRVTGRTVRASVDSAGGESDDRSLRPDLNGRRLLIVFSSPAPNLVPGETNHEPDVVAHDLLTGLDARV